MRIRICVSLAALAASAANGQDTWVTRRCNDTTLESRSTIAIVRSRRSVDSASASALVVYLMETTRSGTRTLTEGDVTVYPVETPIDRAAVAHARPDSLGVARVTVQKSGEYQVRFRAIGHVIVRDTLRVRAGASDTVRIELPVDMLCLAPVRAPPS